MYYLGIDLGGTNIVAGVVDESYQVVEKAKRRTHVPCSPDEIAGQLAETALEALKNAGLTLNDIPYVGIGTPGTVNPETGILEYANNLYFHNLELRKLLSDKLNKKVVIENDANAAAYGEFRAGALKGARNALLITLGTGIGSGIIINGKIYSGSNFAGGEMGHTVIVANGRPCTCGRKGCWEAYASATGLIASTREAMRANPESAMWKIAGGSLENVDGRTAFDAMRASDADGKAVVDEFIFYLACGLINCINILQPDILCIGGGVCNEGETLLRPLREYIQKENYAKHTRSHTALCRARLGNDAGIVGAALLDA